LKIRQEAPPKTVARSSIQIARFFMKVFVINLTTFFGFPSIHIIRKLEFRCSNGLIEKERSGPECDQSVLMISIKPIIREMTRKRPKTCRNSAFF